MADKTFYARKFSKGTWVIEGAGCYSYLLIGEEKAMMVDTGMSRSNLREFVETFTTLPVLVVNTHGHFDHTGGNGWFDEVYMHPNSVKDAKRIFNPADAAAYPLDYTIQTVQEGHVFDLGGRTIEVIEIPAHNSGSIALLDRENRLLFSGDELEAGQVLLMLEGEKGLGVEQHQRNMMKLKKRTDEFDMICPAHNGTPIDNSYINAFIENDQRVLDGIQGKTDISSPSLPAKVFPNGEYTRRSEYKGSSIVYDTRCVFGKGSNEV